MQLKICSQARVRLACIVRLTCIVSIKHDFFQEINGLIWSKSADLAHGDMDFVCVKERKTVSV